jgi:hypothetical protein
MARPAVGNLKTFIFFAPPFMTKKNGRSDRSMNNDDVLNNDRKMTSIFERFLSLWMALCIIAGILLGKIAPGVAQYLESLAIYVKGVELFIEKKLVDGSPESGGMINGLMGD